MVTEIQPINLPKLNHIELNILVYLLYKIHNAPTKGLVFYFKEIKQLNKKKVSKQETLEILNKLREKIMDTNYNLYKIFKYFDIYPTSDNKFNYVIIQKEEAFIDILQQLIGDFSENDLKIFLNLQKKYSKTLYLLFKQYDNKRKIVIFKNNFNGFCEYLNIKNLRLSNLNHHILNPAIEELSKIYEDLCYIKNKDKRYQKYGGKLVGISFKFNRKLKINTM